MASGKQSNITSPDVKNKKEKNNGERKGKRSNKRKEKACLFGVSKAERVVFFWAAGEGSRVEMELGQGQLERKSKVGNGASKHVV